ncbi:stage III sporulation protein AG [Peribacillus cavernae]|uniref:Stage III sporulation protein AG n=1 Tax=Peribacillus cavernae TaxID=1674310 RepID=A0A3S0VIB2_9BACI|nr:stage III sporulation protein AG [Peribacillus cavernae]MDQ0220806.1 stage III sporulation protein AG [Peribacillus cavernae]RUQ24768.1 stage III sporulation protein AG [Peribacillus cavernae]
MKNDKGPLTWLSKLFNKETDPKEKKPSKYAYVFLVLIMGVGIMMAGNFLTGGQESELAPDSNDAMPALGSKASEEEVPAFGGKEPTEIKSIKDYEKYLQTEMKEALEAISGVDDVKVVVNVDASEQKIFEKNKVTQKQVTEETDQEGGKRTVEDTNIDEQLVIIKSGEKEGPIVLETKKPKIRGVLVVAKGAENIQIKKWIIEAITRSLDVPSHRVSVMPKK